MSEDFSFIPSIFIIVAITSYLKELFEKRGVQEPESNIVICVIPIIVIITTIMIVMIWNGSSEFDLYLTDWLCRFIIIEAITLYLIQVYPCTG